MLSSKDINTLIIRAIEKRDKHRREGHDETGEWWDGYRTALQIALGDHLPLCRTCGGRHWLMPLSYDEGGVPCPKCNSDGKLEVNE